METVLNRLERRKVERLEKDSEIYKIMSSVFDSSTLLTLYHLVNRGVIDVFYGVVSTGKEANIFCGIDKKGNFVAVKIYRIVRTEKKTPAAALKECLADYQHPVPLEVLEAQIKLAIHEASDLEFVPTDLRPKAKE